MNLLSPYFQRCGLEFDGACAVSTTDKAKQIHLLAKVVPSNATLPPDRIVL